jgi:2'-5' RNA ligase
MRTFIAVELPPSFHKRLTDLQQGLAESLKQAAVSQVVRWTPAENIHLTLRFLGDASEAQRRQLAHGLAAIALAHAPFDLALTGVGCFPSFRRPNIVWTGVVGRVDLLNSLQHSIERLAQAAGFAAEDRPFSPHLTIARIRRDASPTAAAKAGDVLKTLSDDSSFTHWSVPLAVVSIALIHSDLRPSGPSYTALARFDLAGREEYRQ